ncbi:hypothetical protein ACXNAM_06900 [Kluyvera cryocrescens]|nr:hypothetical protein [Kluyvera cryocrescens]HEP1899061.1 hypothetical protein [Kluyvera cryocrescens]
MNEYFLHNGRNVFSSLNAMKKILNAQLHNEYLGQAILDMVIQQIPISEHNLVEQLRIMQSRMAEPNKIKIVQSIIDGILGRLKDVSAGENVGDHSDERDSGQAQYTSPHHNKKLH